MKKKHDRAHRLTNLELSDLEQRIAAEYKKAADDLQDKIDDYFAKLKKRDAEKKKLIGQIVNGKEYTEEDYKQWRLAQIGRGKRFEALRDRVAERMTNANEVSAAYINDTTPGIYSLNRNYAAYTIEKEVGADVGFTIWDEQTVKRLVKEQPDLMPYYPPKRAVKRGIDLAWGKKQITAQVTQGILMGESIKHLSDRLQTNIPNMNRDSAIRAARTAVTGAQNAGRQDSYLQAENMGIELEKEWVSTLDGKTRPEHADADGQVVAIDESFIVGGEKLEYPGDPHGSPWNIYQCRCTMIAKVKGVDTSDAKRRDRAGLLPDMTYAQWENTKRGEGLIAADVYAKKESEREKRDRKQFAEYKEILGKNAPKSFAKFQDLKYNEPEKWADIKKQKRQTVFVNNAPCETTIKKFSEFFLKPGAKHSQDFFDVGYTPEDVLQLRYDMVSQFNMDKAVDFSTNKKGEEKFNIYMKLGITSKKRFRTCWQKDTPDSLPRIITAFRDDKV